MKKEEEITTPWDNVNDNSLVSKKLQPLAADVVKSFSDWFEINLTIKVFGKVIFTLQWPPKK